MKENTEFDERESNMSHRIDVRLSFVGCLLMVLALLSAPGNVCSARGDSALLRVHYPAAGHSVTVRGSAGGLSWTVGQPTAADASGNTFTYTLVGLTAPIEWKPLLDDATWSLGPNYHVAPGQTVDVWPHFTTTQGLVVTLIPAFHSTVLGNDRAIYAYLPASYYENTDATYPVVYMQDGQNLWAALPQLAFGATWNVDTAFDAAAETGTCSAGGVVGWGAQPLGGTPVTCTGDGDCPSGECRTFPEAIVIGVANTANRIYEYTPTTDPSTPGGGGAANYLQMLTNELKPTIDAMLRTRPDAGSTAIVGSSLGGLVSAYAALQRPDVFGLVGELSPSTWWNNDVIVTEVGGTLPAPNRPQIVYVDSGEGTIDDQADTDLLAAQYLALGYVDGVNFRHVVQQGAQHSETYWAERFPGAMQLLLGVTGGASSSTASLNHPPVLVNPIPNLTNIYGTPLVYTFPANPFSDPDAGQTLTYAASNVPPGITFDGPSGTFSGTALVLGTYNVTVTATDNGEPPLSATCTFPITIIQSQSAPVCPSGTTLNGLNVSQDNGTVDWNTIAANQKMPFAFAFARVSDGTNADSLFDANYTGIQAAGMVRGSYQLFHPSQDPVAQANLFLAKLGKLGLYDLPPALDVEVTDGLSSKDIVSAIQAWVATMQSAIGRPPIIYSSANFWNSSVADSSLSKDPLWVADWDVKCPTLPSAWSAWKFWQTTIKGSVPGISGAVDLDIFNGSPLDLAAASGSGPTCSDGVKNGSETDVDCGGTCPPCGLGRHCNTGSDCASGVCGGNVCVTATGGSSCGDGVKNGTETDVDCGGGSCPPCSLGKSCNTGSDCASGVCSGNVCVSASISCVDGVKNGTETDVDCGGGSCPGCYLGQSCNTGSDCASGLCSGNVCVSATGNNSCEDGVKNGSETDVDCGGGACPPCSLGKSCLSGSDCESGVCSGNICVVGILVNPIPDVTNPFGTPLVYSLPPKTFSDPIPGRILIYTANKLPPGIMFDGPSLTFSGTVASAGTYAVTVTATDNGVPPLSANATFEITVQPNQPPQLVNAIPNLTAGYGSAFFYAIPASTFSDPDAGQTLTYAASNLPPGITFDGPSRTFSGITSSLGTYTVTIIATDNGVPPLSATGSFQITVQQVPTPQWGLNAQVRWAWQPVQFPQYADVWCTPVVARIFDSNGDGVVDEHDDPSIIFVSGNDTTGSGLGTTCTAAGTALLSACHSGVLRIVNGRTGVEQFSLDKAFPGSGGFAGISVAAGDVLRNGTVQIVAVSAEGYVVVVGSAASPPISPLSVLRISDKPIQGNAANDFGWGGALSIADMDGDGFPEIAYGRTVFTSTSGAITLRWAGSGGMGGPAASPALSTMASLDGNGLELLAGNTAYKADGSILWQNPSVPDGFNAVADLDGDGKPDVVLVANGQLWILEGATGATKLGPVMLPGTGSGGPPVVADFDGDGKPEIGVAKATAYSVLKPDFTHGQINLLWQATTHDLSSSVTASTAFDFEGNGHASVLYSDECFLWVFDGATGAVRFAAPHTSFTGTESPVVADVDGDGRAEIVMVSNGVDPTANGWGCLGSIVNGVAWQPSVFPAQPYRGITVFGSGGAPWAKAPAMWNEATFHVSNISDGTGSIYPGLRYGAIPTNEVANWTVPWLNNFRQNKLLPNTPPVAKCKNVTVSAGSNYTATASIDDGSFDPDSGDTITLAQTPPGPYSLGDTLVTLTVTDNHGASNSCSSTVTVKDTTPPSITCPANMSAGCSLDLLAVVTFPTPGATDTCDPHPTVTCTPASGSASFPVGVTTVLCRAVDASGNSNSCTFTVTRAPLGFTGFVSPIGGEVALGTGGSYSNPVQAFKFSSTIPIKFVASCGGSPVSTGVHTLQVTKYSSATDSDPAIDATPTDAATTGNQFTLTDATTGQWHFNLSTKPLSIGTWLLAATLSDGTVHQVWITIKK
jgi:predicted alpha/beta superfamily hydrolase/GH25 family lysozyme M1 (1,4-beta-N-acetylmuramidase)